MLLTIVLNVVYIKNKQSVMITIILLGSCFAVVITVIIFCGRKVYFTLWGFMLSVAMYICKEIYKELEHTNTVAVSNGYHMKGIQKM
jgi:hypothetical protein